MTTPDALPPTDTDTTPTPAPPGSTTPDPHRTPRRRRTRRTAFLVAAGLGAAGLTACSAAAADGEGSAVRTDSVWDESVVHDVDVEADEDDLTAAVTTYVETGEKEWITADVTIDGTLVEDVGLKLKGNSSLRGVSADDDPVSLPWIIRTDKFVDDQDYLGETEIVVRSNSSQTSLNEAVALDLLGQTGLATEEASASRFSVNGSDETLRLLVQNPSDTWDAEQFDSSGMLYKAESGGDYSYRGDDPSAYEDVFDQEAGEDDLEPLMDFLEFVDTADDETFSAELEDHLDVEAFATYLAFQDLVANDDDIDGRGNNSYLRYDEETGLMTVVNWDLNLAFGASPAAQGGEAGTTPDGVRPGGQAGGPAQGAPPADAGAGAPQGGPGAGGLGAGTDAGTTGEGTGAEGTGDGAMGAGAMGAGAMGGSNVLTERFLADDEFAALYEAAQDELDETLVDSGAGLETLDSWTTVLEEQADDLVDVDTIEQESDAVAEYLS
ncbi:spore coat protein CotH [Sediminihabitans luteus]|uniref:Spore coat protein CotH n=1 Tax=Sediminihabitans luteus TaxID=1138585 RepID=A0A2M9CQ95_9CELL|nr:CotH kinase family protein [Sediminihabitans luteus]PJJ74096.1 spore coat protein CotH [Sediminihabitans luteus]GII97989.1 hypothetical protein Slu03_03670 [Sediminihabitans luteus]